MSIKATDNGILSNAAIAVPLKYLSNFWRSLQMPFISWKVELKLQWTENCVLAVAGKMIMLMPILVILFLISKTQNNYMSL